MIAIPASDVELHDQAMRLPAGSFAETPEALARAMVEAIDRGGIASWLEPSVGDGRFLSALLDIGVAPVSITGVDVRRDIRPTTVGQELLLGVDFIEWALDTDRRFDRIVGNPPYAKMSAIGGSLREAAFKASWNGFRVSPECNYWMAFVIASLRVLRPGGSLCFVLPAGWEFTDYAATLRERLPEAFREFETHRCMRPLFESVRDGCVVIVGRGFLEPNASSSKHNYEEPATLIAGLGGPPRAKRTCDDLALRGESTVRFGDIARVSIGAVTGDSRFFLLTEDQRMGLGLPHSALVPVVSKARHLLGSELGRVEWKRLLRKGERVWLFRPSAEALMDSCVVRYLERPEEDGGCRRSASHVVRRNLWYIPEIPFRADGFISGMSGRGPFLCLRRWRRLTATNTLYVVQFRGTLNLEEKAAWALALLSSSARLQVRQVVRRYPDGLTKLEPRDLRELRVAAPPVRRGVLQAYARAVEDLLAGDMTSAEARADGWLGTG